MFLKKFLVVVGCGLSLSLCASENSAKSGINISAFDNSIKLKIPSFSCQSYPSYQNSSMPGKKSPDRIEDGIASPVKDYGIRTGCFTPVQGQPIFFVSTDLVHQEKDLQDDETTPLSKLYAKRPTQTKSEASTSCCQKLVNIFCWFR